MPADTFSFRQRQLLIQAQHIIDAASADYIHILTQHIQNLSDALASGNLPEAIQSCYLIQSQAGAFGWPLATEIAGWFKRLLEQQKSGDLNRPVNELFLDSLNHILEEELKTESEAAIRLLQHIEMTLKHEKFT